MSSKPLNTIGSITVEPGAGVVGGPLYLLSFCDPLTGRTIAVRGWMVSEILRLAEMAASALHMGDYRSDDPGYLELATSQWTDLFDLYRCVREIEDPGCEVRIDGVPLDPMVPISLDRPDLRTTRVEGRA